MDDQLDYRLPWLVISAAKVRSAKKISDFRTRGSLYSMQRYTCSHSATLPGWGDFTLSRSPWEDYAAGLTQWQGGYPARVLIPHPVRPLPLMDPGGEHTLGKPCGDRVSQVVLNLDVGCIGSWNRHELEVLWNILVGLLMLTSYLNVL
ncbi:unnamed protein product [Ectocarpus sp. 12 AP-2014]